MIPVERQCCIREVGLARNGQPRWWCNAHGGNASGRGGARLDVCQPAGTDEDLVGCLDLDPAEYPGGIGIWAALEPVLNTTGRSAQSGIHVHARKSATAKKEIDGTFPAVRVRCSPDLFGPRNVLIRRAAALGYYFGRLLGHRLKYLTCPRCGEGHLDSDEFALRPHRRHLCHACGRHFHDSEDAISNPIVLARKQLEGIDANGSPEMATETLDVRLSDYPGGVQIWASNPAILWTGRRSEQEGIHVHLFPGKRGGPEPDETFSLVRLDGVSIDIEMVRYLMAQQALPHLVGKIDALVCSKCGQPHLDRHTKALMPHSEHECEHCGATFRPPGRRRLSVSNPLISAFGRLLGPQSPAPDQRKP